MQCHHSEEYSTKTSNLRAEIFPSSQEISLKLRKVKPAWKGTLVQSSHTATQISNEIKNNMNIGVIVGVFHDFQNSFCQVNLFTENSVAKERKYKNLTSQ